MKLIHKGKDITEIVTNLTWSGDYTQASRTLDFGIAVSSNDYYLPTVSLMMGDSIRLLDDKDKEVWQGYVFSKEKSINNSEMSVTCYDGLIYLLKSKGTYNFKNMTPDAITRKVASDFGIPVGKLEGGSNLSRIFDAETIYNIVMTAYTIESGKSKKLYMPKMIEGKLNVILKGNHTAKFVLDSKTTIVDSSYGESMEDSINKVKIYDKEGNPKGEVNLSGIAGTLQEVYKEEEGVDIQEGAKSLLRDIEKTASIEALGDYECITGNAVIIKEPFTGLNGLFYIDNDTHTFENGQHMMSLGLSFKNIMDFQESGEDPAEIARREAERVSSSPSTNARGKRGEFIKAAESMLGFTYSQANRFGASSADCSSLVGRAMKMAGITNNAQLTTRSIGGDSRFERISKTQMRPGDILWQSGHMGIFLGNNRLIEASYSAKRVKYANLGNRFSYAYRIKGID